MSLSAQTLMMSIQAIALEIDQLTDGQDIDELSPDEQEVVKKYTKAAAELKTAYNEARKANPSLPDYESLAES